MDAAAEKRVDILLVEDDAEDYLLTKDILARCNHGFVHDLDWVVDGSSALDAAEARRYDICLVDYRLGAEDGIGVIRQLLSRSDDLAAILLTGQGDHEVDVEAARAGASDYLVKGEVSPTLLERTIRYALRSRADLRALRESEELKSAILALALDAIVTVDDNGLIVDFNPAAEEMFGYGRGDAVGRALADLLPGEEQIRHHGSLAQQLASGGMPAGVRIEQTARRADGQAFPIELSVSRGELAGRPFYTGYIRDLTDTKRADQERRSLEDQLRQAQKMEALGRLVGGITHDFNNMLAVVSGYTELLGRGLTTADPLQTNVERIRGATQRATALTRQLLAFSRQHPMNPRVIDLNEVIAELEPMLDRVVEHDVTMVMRLDPELGNVRADRTQMEQILMNLAVNARDAMPEGGTLTIETRNQVLRRDEPAPGEEASSFAVLSVTDTGVGMDAATLTRAFEPFFTTKGVGKGTGLGLSTIYGIVKHSDGFVSVESEPGQGATFNVHLPLVDAAVDPPVGAAAPELLPPRSTASVLVVEDDAALLALFAEMLEMDGCTVLRAANAEEALALVDHAPDRIDALVSDIMMPGMTGIELATTLRAANPSLPVLLVSGYSELGPEDPRVQALDAQFLRKPFGLVELTAAVRALLAAVHTA